MPPLEMAPGSYFAAKGSAEHDELTTLAHQGQYEIWGVVSESGKSDIYDIFTPDNEAAQSAGPAFTFEQAREVLVLKRKYPIEATEETSRKSSESNSSLASRIGKILFKRK